MRTLLLAICLSALPSLAADTYSFSISPAENVSGLGGLTFTGWGYTIQNQSSTDWLVTTDLNAGTFLYATPQAIFDFPDVAPGARVTLPFDPLMGAGLYEILWDQNAPAGFVNSGVFTLGAQWWNSNPANGGTLIDVAPNASQPYTASLTATPEPAPGALIAFSMLLFGGIALRKRRR